LSGERRVPGPPHRASVPLPTRALRRIGAAALVACLLAAAGAGAQPAPAPERSSGWSPKSLVFAPRDMVAAAHPAAVDAGVAMLAAGGAAIDAAIAAQMVLNLVEPQSSGIGGGAFVVAYDARTRDVATWDGRETAPAGADPTLFLDAAGKPMPFAQAQVGGRSVGTPGLLRVLELAHREHGRLPWAALFGPAIRLAQDGFALSPRLHVALAAAHPALREDRFAGPYFFQPDGSPKPVGTLLRNAEFAATLRAVATDGADAFYRGAVARDIVAAVRGHATNPGTLAAADLAAYRAVRRPPLCGRYRERTICGMGMPSSGTATMLMTLALVEPFDLRATGTASAPSIHLLSEAQRLAFTDRNRYMADADFVPVPVAGMLDPAYLATRRKAIDAARSMGVPTAGAPPGCCAQIALADGVHADAAGTSHVSVVDGEGNAVSMTTTIESAFGSHLMVRGFLLNNQLTDFSFAPIAANGAAVANRIEPGKRPRSSMAPVVVLDARGDLDAVVGSPGGAAIIQYVTKWIVGRYDWGLDAQAAIDLGNFGAQASAVTQLERGTAPAALEPALAALGHRVVLADFNSGIHAVVARRAWHTGSAWLDALAPRAGWEGAADPRREGVAAGTPATPTRYGYWAASP
jgi:gamma-glutamyltranspeptidase/glutathione hydrolase